MNNLLVRGRVWVLLCIVAVFGAGCASSNTPGDPMEGFNRAMFGFNEALDDAVLKPIATGYKNITPEPARDCVGNVFSNINDVFVAINSLLQGKAGDAVSDACRVLINSTVGILGCFDVASKVGLEKHNRDFGQTFGKWGIASGPYLVLPFLGPSNIRDGVGRVIYSSLDPVWANHIPTRNVAYSLRTVDTRASLLTAGRAVEDAALDKYAFLRDAYVQRRQSMIDDDSNRARDRRSDAGDQPSTSAVERASPAVFSLPSAELPTSVWLDEANQRAGNRVKLTPKPVAVVGVPGSRTVAALAQSAN
jgi:phospholipid-binding lipoprotein MlaA